MANNRELSTEILNEIKNSILSKDYGSVEIYIEKGEVVQITERTIKKTVNSFKPDNGRTVRTYSYNNTVKR